MENKRYFCPVCGYIHEGDLPPRVCPVCGVPGEEFELIENNPRTFTAKVQDAYRCLNCEYIHEGDAPPETCPVCGLTADGFELIAKHKAGSSDYDGHVVIIGAGIAGLSCAKTLREESKNITITILSAEEGLPYYRLNLTRFLNGTIDASDLTYYDQYSLDQLRIAYHPRSLVTGIDPNEKVIELSSGRKISYDKLVIATGAHPFVPPFEGTGLLGVRSLRTKEDANEILSNLESEPSAIILGGGVLGLEAAAGLAARGGKVTVVEGAPWLMPRQLNQQAANYLSAYLENLGVDLVYGFSSESIIREGTHLKLVGKDGRVLKAHQIILATGVRPNTYLGRLAGLTVNKGIVVDDHMRTSHDAIYACGDVAEHYGLVYGLWNIALAQGEVAAQSILGLPGTFGSVPSSSSLKVLDVNVFSVGQITIEDASYQTYEAVGMEDYMMVLIKDKKMIGAIAINHKHKAMLLKGAVESGKQLTGEIKTLNDVLAQL